MLTINEAHVLVQAVIDAGYKVINFRRSKTDRAVFVELDARSGFTARNTQVVKRKLAEQDVQVLQFLMNNGNAKMTSMKVQWR